jgi:hypothetical protein
MIKNFRGLLTRRHARRTEGALLVELMISVAVIAVGMLSYLLVAQKNLVAQREAIYQDKASVMFANVAEEMRQTDFDTLYSSYEKQYVADTTGKETVIKEEIDNTGPGSGRETQYYLENLKTSDGSDAEIKIEFETDETSLSSKYGPVMDLDGDGSMDTADVVSTGTPDILPTKMTLTFDTPAGTRTYTKYIVIRR